MLTNYRIMFVCSRRAIHKQTFVDMFAGYDMNVEVFQIARLDRGKIGGGDRKKYLVTAPVAMCVCAS